MPKLASPDQIWGMLTAIEAPPAEVLFAILVMFGFLLICALFSTAETAMFSLQKVDQEALKEDPAIGDMVRQCLDDRRKLLAGLLIGTEAAGAGLSASSASVLSVLVPGLPWLNILIVSPLMVFFGDVIPKTLALRYPRALARRVVKPLHWWNRLVRPLRWALTAIVDRTLLIVGIKPADENETVQEQHVRVLIDQGRATGIIQPMEQEIIHRVFDFGDLPVSRLMTPRPDIFSLSLTTPWPEILATIKEHGYSRVPFYQGESDNIVGILHIKELLKLRQGPPPNARQLQKLLYPPLFIPPSKRAQDLLREFRQRNLHMAIVVDEHGSVVGLITLDDLLTELVGEMLDETDAEEPEVKQIAANIWSVRAGIDIEDFQEKLDVEIPEGDYTTLGGFIFHQLGAAPQKGDEVFWDGMRMLVAGVEGRRITEVTVSFETQEVSTEKEQE